MIDISKIDYSVLDRPEILMFLFHPRPEWGSPRSAPSVEDILIQVEEDVAVGARFHLAGKQVPFLKGMRKYMEAVEQFAGGLGKHR